MKSLTSILVIVLISTEVSGQQLSAGYTLGLTNWMYLQKGEQPLNAGVGGQNASFDRTLFVRYETKKRFAFEAGFIYDGLQHPNEHYYGVDLKAQYDITCTHVSCPVLKKLKTYVGVSVTPTYMNGEIANDYPEPSPNNGEYPYLNNKIKDFELWVGLSNTINYALCDHLNIVSVVNFQANTLFRQEQGFVWKNQPDSRLSFQLGAAYKFH